MNQETMENLGFTEENSLQTEENRKKELVEKFLKINKYYILKYNQSF